MTPLSDRRHDAFDNPAKMACRAGNLRVLREAAYLLWEDGDRTRLRCDWCELMGATGLLTLDLLEREDVLAPGGFVGIDLDPARIDGFRQQRPDLKWVAGNLYERLDLPELANVGVLNLDAYGEVGDPSAQGISRSCAAWCSAGWRSSASSPCSGTRTSIPSSAADTAEGRPCADTRTPCAGPSPASCPGEN